MRFPPWITLEIVRQEFELLIIDTPPSIPQKYSLGGSALSSTGPSRFTQRAPCRSEGSLSSFSKLSKTFGDFPKQIEN
jgi:hypothetical protein